MTTDEKIERMLARMRMLEGTPELPEDRYVRVRLRCKHETIVPGWAVADDLLIECYECDSEHWDPLKWRVIEWWPTDRPCGQRTEDYRSPTEKWAAKDTDKLWNVPSTWGAGLNANALPVGPSGDTFAAPRKIGYGRQW